MYTTIQSFEVCKNILMFWKSLAHQLFDQKYNNIVKYYYNLW